MKFKEIAPGLPLPPQPIITRWGIWLDAVVYYAKHYRVVVQIINTFNEHDCAAIPRVKYLFSDQLEEKLKFMNNQFWMCVQNNHTIRNTRNRNVGSTRPDR